MIIKPMSAGKFDEKYIKFPVYVSPKLDGVRCLAINGQPMSKSMKILPSKHLQAAFKSVVSGNMHGLDGEIIVGEPTAEDCCRSTVSHVMSHDKVYKFTYYVFDMWASDHFKDGAGFSYRYRELVDEVEYINQFWPEFDIRLVHAIQIQNMEQLNAYEADCLAQGHEGIMIRSPDSPYKHGRSSSKEAYLLKLKRWEDAEGEIIGYEERMHNENEATISELGYMERASFKDGMVPTNTLGAYHIKVLNGPFKGEKLRLGSGFKGDERVNLWQTRDADIGKIVKFKYFAVGTKDLPRFPIYLSFRDKIDMLPEEDD